MEGDFPPHESGELLAMGGLVDSSRLTLGVHGDDLDPNEVSRILGCMPSRSHRRGDLHHSSTPYPRGAWLLSVEADSPTGPEELVHLLFSRLPTDESVWSVLRAKYELSLGFGIFTAQWNREFRLTPEAVARINSLGAGVGFDIYVDEDDEITIRQT